MKHQFSILCALMAVLVLSSCGPNEPSSVNNSLDSSPINSTPLTDSTVIEPSTSVLPPASSTPTITTCLVTFNSNGGTSVPSIEVTAGTSIDKPTDPSREGYHFIGWTFDQELREPVTWPFEVNRSLTLFASWNEKIPFKTYLNSLVDSLSHDPYSYIPTTMRPTNSANYVTADQVTYDFTSFNQVSAIRYGGFGEQWNMVIDNIQESQRFYAVLTACETAINGSVALFNNYFDHNPSNSADHQLEESSYTASILFEDNTLFYEFAYKTNLSLPLFGSITPKIEMTYNIATFEKSVKIQLTNTNALKYLVTDNTYTFAISYGLEAVSRKAYFQITRDQQENIHGSIYEFIQFRDSDLVPSCAEFYIEDGYVTAVGNKASGMPGFKGTINELYETNQGKLIGYKVQEKLTIATIEGTYHTLWFNLNSINGITSIKAIANDNLGQYGNNNHDIYLNNSSTIFTPAKNSKLFVETSRKYDVELRKQYFYGLVDENLTEYETAIPMMFIQDDNDQDTNFTDFPNDMSSISKIQGASVNLASKYLSKIRSDYDTYISIFEGNRESITGEYIAQFIGDAI